MTFLKYLKLEVLAGILEWQLTCRKRAVFSGKQLTSSLFWRSLVYLMLNLSVHEWPITPTTRRRFMMRMKCRRIESSGISLVLSYSWLPDLAQMLQLRESAESVLHEAAHRVLKYLKGTQDYGLRYERNLKAPLLSASFDADFAGDEGDRKSRSGTLSWIMIVVFYEQVAKKSSLSCPHLSLSTWL